MIGLEPTLVSPTSLAEAYALLARQDDGASGDDRAGAWRPIAGGTDVMVQLAAAAGEAETGGEAEPDGPAATPAPQRLLDLWSLDELRGLELSDDGRELVVGALTTYTEIRRSPLCQAHLPALVEAAATIGAAQIQNRGTLGGNVVNASPAGDTLPVFLAADARIVLGSARGERSVAAADFWPAYRRTARADDELVLRLRIPLPTRRQMRFRKVGTRRAQAISKVVLALAWREDGGVWRDVRLAFGSVAPTPIRTRETEAVLEGAAPRKTVADHAVAVLSRELQPIDDIRSTAAYRLAVAGRVLHRLLREAGGW